MYVFALAAASVRRTLENAKILGRGGFEGEQTKDAVDRSKASITSFTPGAS